MSSETQRRVPDDGGCRGASRVPSAPDGEALPAGGFVDRAQRDGRSVVGSLRSPLVNVLWRTLLVLVRARRRLRREGPLDPNTVTRMRLRVLPTDIDVLRHLNNGRYLSLFDLGRWDLLTRSGLVSAMTEKGWYAVVAAETITFRRSLELWQRFELETRLIGHDDRAVYLERRALVGDEIYARAIIRARILRRTGGTVPHDELFAAVGRPEGLPDIEPWVHEWAAGSSLPSTRRPAPSVWE